ncbi:MAG: hypothetical protein N3B01_11025 [Verrucomicrobiae bacterium]|nr:hypothetical protein [Verrucomicrobiae bacterium]
MSGILLPYTRHCFVCGATNPHGLRLRFWADGNEVRAEFRPDDRHEGYRGIVHGGVLASALDEAMFWAAAYVQRRFYVSVQLDVRFHKKVVVGMRYLVLARVVECERRVCHAAAELHGVEREVCVSATGRFFPIRREQVPLQHEDFYPDPRALSPRELFRQGWSCAEAGRRDMISGNGLSR